MPGMTSRRTAKRARAISKRGVELGRDATRLDVAWARWLPVRVAREGFLAWLLSPVMNVYTRRRSKRREVLKRLRGPVVFVANHSSHLDTPVILRALPRRWRSRTAVAAAADYFYSKRRIAIAVSLIFGTVPIARCGGGAGRDSLDHLDRLMRKRWNVLMFPEGTRSRDGDVGRLRSGAVLLAARRHVPIVPISVTGTSEAMPPGQSWPRRIHHGWRSRRHAVEVTFGDPILVEDESDIESIKDRVHAFFDRQRETGPERAAAAARAVVNRVRREDGADGPDPAQEQEGVQPQDVVVHPPVEDGAVALGAEPPAFRVDADGELRRPGRFGGDHAGGDVAPLERSR
jgi:1-acyl-sn-glycerol-3-phosphate acyltransferase